MTLTDEQIAFLDGALSAFDGIGDGAWLQACQDFIETTQEEDPGTLPGDDAMDILMAYINAKASKKEQAAEESGGQAPSEVGFRISHNNQGMVGLEFSQPVTTIVIPAGKAMELAQAIAQHAQKANALDRRIIVPGGRQFDA